MTPFKRKCRVTSKQGDRMLNGKWEKHRGGDMVPTDYATQVLPEKDWEVREVTGGVVINVFEDKWRGKCVDVRTSPKHVERYQHLNSIAVAVGDVVKQGQVIGVAGTTGSCVGIPPNNGRHLHFEVVVTTSNDKNVIGKALVALHTPWSGVPNEEGPHDANDDLDVADSLPENAVPFPGKCEGIDVSKHNGAINWTQVAGAGKSFAIIRCGWAGWDGRILDGVDPFFARNMEGALAVGMDVGVYVYAYCKDVEAAVIAAQDTVRMAKAYKVSYPIFFDIEDAQYRTVAQKQANTDICKAFMAEVQRLGYYGCLYTYTSFANSFLDMGQLAQYDMWIAQYGAKVTYKGSYGIWQHHGGPQTKNGVTTWPGGTCPGVSGWCDLNTSYKDYPTMIHKTGLNGFEGTAVPPGATGGDTVLLLKNFGAKNMQAFSRCNADGQYLAYDRMPVGVRVVVQKDLAGEDDVSRQWKWVELLDERTGDKIYTPLLDDRNQLLELDGGPLLLPAASVAPGIDLGAIKADMGDHIGRLESGVESAKSIQQKMEAI